MAFFLTIFLVTAAADVVVLGGGVGVGVELELLLLLVVSSSIIIAALVAVVEEGVLSSITMAEELEVPFLFVRVERVEVILCIYKSLFFCCCLVEREKKKRRRGKDKIGHLSAKFQPLMFKHCVTWMSGDSNQFPHKDNKQPNRIFFIFL